MLTVGSLFTGYGGLDLAAEAVLDARTAWTSDIDPGARRIIAHRWPDAPNLGDIAAVDWTAVDPVDVITGGFPCQDVSHAGARRGLGPGTRSGLWARMADAIDHLRPQLVIAENVRGLLSAAADSDVEPCPWCLGDGAGEPPLRALGAVLADLAELGYDASWYGLRAADVGAPHGRFRVFILAWPTGNSEGVGVEGRWPRGVGVTRPHAVEGVSLGAGDIALADADDAATDGERARPRPGVGSEDTPAHAHGTGSVRAGGARGWRDGSADGGGHASADATRDGRHEGRPEPAGELGGPDAALCGDAPADADGDGLEGIGRLVPVGRDTDGRRSADIAWGPYEPAIRRWERTLGRPAPAPTEVGAKGGQRLSPPFVEWMMGLPDRWVTAVPGLTRNDQLKALGNGVVPQQAAAALTTLLAWRAAALGAEVVRSA